MGLRSALGACVLVLGSIASARADTINLLTNGTLDKNPSARLNYWGFVTASPLTNSTALPGWTIVSGTVDVVATRYWQPAPGAAYTVDMIGTPGLGVIEQSIPTVSTNNYGLSFYLAANPQVGRGADERHTTKRLLVEALAADGSTVLASQTFQMTDGSRTTADMQYVSESFSFTATGTTSTLRLTALPPLNLPSGRPASDTFTGPVIGNLVLQDLGSGSLPTPEPASLGLLASGAATLLCRRRPRR